MELLPCQIQIIICFCFDMAGAQCLKLFLNACDASDINRGWYWNEAILHNKQTGNTQRVQQHFLLPTSFQIIPFLFWDTLIDLSLSMGLPEKQAFVKEKYQQKPYSVVTVILEWYQCPNKYFTSVDSALCRSC